MRAREAVCVCVCARARVSVGERAVKVSGDLLSVGTES